jgi:unsaturated chondroitin disaccharide hydrolase
VQADAVFEAVADPSPGWCWRSAAHVTDWAKNGMLPGRMGGVRRGAVRRAAVASVGVVGTVGNGACRTIGDRSCGVRSQALAGLLRRVEQTRLVASGRFPMFADPLTGEWTWSRDGGWFGGFWPGMLWLAATTRGRRLADVAADSAQRLGSRAGAPTVLRGFLFWYGAGISSVLDPGRPAAAELAIAAARSLAAGFDPVAGLLPPGAEDAGLYGWPRPGACIDGMPGTVPLLAFAAAATGEDRLRGMALAHARGLAALCMRADGSVAQSATYDGQGRLAGQATIEGSSRDSTWARGQCWAMLGLAQAAHLAGGEFTATAARVADWYLDHLPADGVCFWDFDDPAIPHAPRDTSAAAIAAAALLKLAALGESRYRAAAEHIVDALAERHLARHGGLRDGCYDQHQNLATASELIWGDYFLLEALLALDGAIEPGTL